MTIKDHHLLCLGLLAKIGIQAQESCPSLAVSKSDLKAIREAIASGQNLGLPVEVSEYDAGRPIHRNAKLFGQHSPKP